MQGEHEMATKTGQTQGQVQGQKVVNPANKERNNRNPYAKWTDPRTGWKYGLCKSWQARNRQPLARWFMWVEGYEKEYGDTYVSDLIEGLEIASDITFDTSVWPDKAAFIRWAQGEAITTDK
jgi:hypothetical protein